MSRSDARDPPPTPPMATDLQTFDLSAMLRCGNELQRATATSSSLQEAAQSVCDYFHAELVDGETGGPACALVRYFVTLPFGDRPAEIQRRATTGPDASAINTATRCLTLLGTAGQEADWNDPARSKGHQAIPLPAVEIVQRAPMIARLLKDLGVDVNALLQPAPGLLPELAGRSYNVFHVEHAEGSPFIPAQAEFVEPYGIRSVVGFGGVLPRGELFAVILFSKVRIRRDQAERFRKFATDLRSRAIRFNADQVFAR